MNAIYDSSEAAVPLIISLPHVGTGLVPEVAAALAPVGHAVADTDWHVEQLYDFARTAGAGWLQARLSRYVIDLNRPPDDASLYPGQTTSALCPLETFAGEPLYRTAGPDAAEVARRRACYWQPYHDELARLVLAARARFGHVVVLDGHSIMSVVPRLFDGRLPDINVGTYSGRSCAAGLSDGLVAVLAGQSRFTHVLNGRFKGGYITRHYGNPATGVHAVQFELGQLAYLDEPANVYRPQRATALKDLLRALVDVMVRFRPTAAGS